jgi:hypothetical protein
MHPAVLPAIVIDKAALLSHPNLKLSLIELVEQCNEYEQAYEYWPQAIFYDTFLRCLQVHRVSLHAPASSTKAALQVIRKRKR